MAIRKPCQPYMPCKPSKSWEKGVKVICA